MTFTFVDGLGCVGSLCVIIAYGLNSYQKIRSHSLIFYALNLVGGIFLIIFPITREDMETRSLIWYG